MKATLDFRDDLINKEVAEKLSKEVTSYIIEQIKFNMNAVTIKCRDLMVGDWITNRNGFPMQITNVGEGYAYATFEGNEGGPWEFDDKDKQPQPIEINEDILRKNNWKVQGYTLLPNEHYYVKDEGGNYLLLSQGTLSTRIACGEANDWVFSSVTVPCKYVHQLQQVLRLAGLTDMANNFKVQLHEKVQNDPNAGATNAYC